MRTSTLASLLLLSVAGLSSIREITAQCYDYTDALDISVRTPISCNIINKTKEPTPPSPPNFVVNYKCEIEANQELCTKALQSIQKVGEILTSNLNLITNINVDVTLKNLCPTDAKQPCDVLGGAKFARTMELLDDDNVIREYPSTLVKQFDCEQHYEFGDIDIRAVFNGGNATSLWFEGDPQINLDQKDFRMIVLKAFINALGVQSSFIEQSIFSNVVPKVLTPQLTLAKGNDGVLEFKGFREYAFDKYLISRGKEVKSINELIKPFDDFLKEPNNRFKDEGEFVAKFVQSPQIEVAQNLASISVTQSTLGFQPRGAKPDDAIILETSFNPYQNGISINNFDASINAATEEFLMVSPIASGKTLEDSMGKSQSPLGPKLISLLETLGYPTKQLSGNNFKVCNIPPPPSSPPPPPPPPPSPPPPPPPSPPTATITAITTSITTQVTTTVPVVVTKTVQQGDTSVVETETQHVVTKIESVSQSVVTTVVKVVDVSQTQPPSPTNDPQEGDEDFFGDGSLNIPNNFSLIIFITLISCISIL